MNLQVPHAQIAHSSIAHGFWRRGALVAVTSLGISGFVAEFEEDGNRKL
jgi:hypothetical protein